MTDKPDRKVVVITGASSGIGKATAEALAKQGVMIAMVCRNKERGEKAISKIKEKTPEAQLRLHLADLSLMEEVRTLAKELNDNYPVIDVLINNAGMIPGKQYITIEGWEQSWATNHLAPFLLTNLLMGPLLAAEQGRVINVSSEAHRLGQLDFDNAGKPKNYSAITSYADSKLANILFTYELARRTEFTNLTINCLHPGVVATNFGNSSNLLIRSMMKVGRLFMKSPREGAKTSVFLASSPSVKSISGKYFKNSVPVKSSADSYNTHTALRLWKLSEEQTGYQN
ncbi:SDR family oxidoreductase [Rufibacter roseus]